MFGSKRSPGLSYREGGDLFHKNLLNPREESPGGETLFVHIPTHPLTILGLGGVYENAFKKFPVFCQPCVPVMVCVGTRDNAIFFVFSVHGYLTLSRDGSCSRAMDQSKTSTSCFLGPVVF